jgi:UDP-N-acetylmuramoyl-tripeptide--D-alanyl-D-alanine ligase
MISGPDGERVREMTAQTVAELTGGSLAGHGRARVTGVAIDTRRLGGGEMFVALAGEHTDGHAFLDDAVRAGATALLVREGMPAPGGIASISVDDPLAALGRLAMAERSRSTATVVAITGSSGKTITKDLTASVTGRAFRTMASEASFNNEIGVPLTILAADEETEVLVVEVGARGIGHISSLMPMLRPDVSVVLNVGVAHIGMFGSVEAIATAKGELVEGLDASGVAVLNADDGAVAAMASRSPARVIRFGVSDEADVRAENVSLDHGARATFTLVTPGGRAEVTLGIPGEHIVADALAAAAVGVALGIGAGTIAAGLSSAVAPAWRMETIDAPGGWRVLNDAYNANPHSLAAALKALVAMARGRRTWAVLGGMAELGDRSTAEHDRIGRLVVRLGVGRLVAVGTETRPLFEAARREGMTPEEAVIVADADEAVRVVLAEVEAGDVVLVKASRAAALERAALALAGEGQA